MLTIDQLTDYTGVNAPDYLPGHISQEFTATAETLLINTAISTETSEVQGAIYLLAGYDNGGLLAHWVVRHNMFAYAETLSVAFLGVLSDATVTARTMDLSRHALDTMFLCAGLACGNYVPDLRGMLAAYDPWNKWTASTAFAIACQQLPATLPSVRRARRTERLKAEWEAYAKIQAGTATDEDIERYLEALLIGNGRGIRRDVSDDV